LAEQLTLNQRVAGSSPAQGILEKEGSQGLASFPLNTLCAVALPRLRDLQGNSRRTFGQLLGYRLATDRALHRAFIKTGLQKKGENLTKTYQTGDSMSSVA
jgi:hypothetical protein